MIKHLAIAAVLAATPALAMAQSAPVGGADQTRPLVSQAAPPAPPAGGAQPAPGAGAGAGAGGAGAGAGAAAGGIGIGAAAAGVAAAAALVGIAVAVSQSDDTPGTTTGPTPAN